MSTMAAPTHDERMLNIINRTKKIALMEAADKFLNHPHLLGSEGLSQFVAVLLIQMTDDYLVKNMED